MRLILYIFLTCLAITSQAQVFQTNNQAIKFRGLKADTMLVVPAGIDTPFISNPKWGESITGALFFRTTDSTLWAKAGQRWTQVGQRVDSTAFPNVVDSTGNISFRVLYAQAGKIVGNARMTYDTTFNTLKLGPPGGSFSSTYRLAVNGEGYIDVVRIGTPVVQSDTALFKPVVIWPGAQNTLRSLNRWPVVNDPAKLNISDTAAMLAGYQRTGSGLVADSVILNRLTFQDKQATLRRVGLDTLQARGSGGTHFTSNSGTSIATLGGGGGSNATFNGGVTIAGQTNLQGTLLLDRNDIPIRNNRIWFLVLDTATGDVVRRDYNAQVGDSVGLKRYGVNANNLRGFNSGGLLAAAQFVASVSADSANLLIGNLAGRDLTTGWSNIFQGPQAGLTATTALRNIAIGNQAFGETGIKTGNDNVLIGTRAGRLLTSGTTNVGIGIDALAALTTGSSNTAIGPTAGRPGTGVTLQTGSNNTLIGGAAATTATNTSSATAVGNASRAATYSTTVGDGAIYDGQYGISIGYRTQISGGENNVRIGSGRNTAQQNVITGSNNILLGGASRLPDSTQSNQINFWVNAINAGVNGMEGGWNALTRFSGGQWLINQNSSVQHSVNASAALEINGTTRGLLIPRMTSTQRNAISSPATGLQVYNTTDSAVQTYNGTFWDVVKTVVKSNSTSITSSTTLAPDPELQVALEPGVWEIDLQIVAPTSAGGWRFNFTGPTDAGWVSTHNIGYVLGNNNLIRSAATSTTTVTTTGGNAIVLGFKFVWVCTDSGNLVFQWAQNTSNAAATVVLPNSFIRARRIK